jgi:hypothetical protein
MDNAEHERYIFLRFASASVEEAMRIVQEHNDSLPLRIGYAALRYAVICYLRPFTKGETRFQFIQRDGSLKRQISLPKSTVPTELTSLHEYLITCRHGAYAHTDIVKLVPQLRYWPASAFEFPISFKPIDRKPLHLHKDAMLKLFQAVHTTIGELMRNSEELIQREAKVRQNVIGDDQSY